MRRTELKRSDKPLKRVAVLMGSRARANGIKPVRRAVSPATPAQREKVRGVRCIACHGSIEHDAPSRPAHLIPRSMTTSGQDDELAVVPLGPVCHRLYDTGQLDLLPYLEPAWRGELAFAVARVGLVATYRRVTNNRAVAVERVPVEPS